MSLQENKEENYASENNDEVTKKSSESGTNSKAHPSQNPDEFSEFNDSDKNFSSLSDYDSSEAEVLTQDQQKIVALENELSSVQTKLNETHQKMLRIAADADNTRKRLEREKFDTRLYSIQEFAKDLLPVIDSFEKALQMNESSAEAQPSIEQSNAMAEGVKLVSKIFQDAIKKHGIERLPGKDSPFNPSYHNAIAKEVDAKYKSETVAEEFMAGYKIGDRILRTALVKVGAPD